MKQRKIQKLLIDHLMKSGQIRLVLPDNMVIEIGICQEDRYGNLVKEDDYCWAIMTQHERTASMDKYNLGLRIPADCDNIFIDDDVYDDEGRELLTLDVV